MEFAGLPRLGLPSGVAPGIAAMLAVLTIAASASATTFGGPSALTRLDPYARQATLNASDEIGTSLVGSAVALSSDGKTALVGGRGDNGQVGAAWVFRRRGSKWTAQAKLTGGGEIGKANSAQAWRSRPTARRR